MRRWLLPLLLLAGCESLENRYLYFPTPGDSKEALPAPLEDLTLTCADGTKIHARWCPHAMADNVLLYCHGNAGNLEDRGRLMLQFASSLGCSVLMFDYPGFGRSEGKPSEAGCYASAHAAYNWLVKEKGCDPQRIILCGESLGGGVAVELASKKPHQALVLIRTFTSVPAVASSHSVWLCSAPLFMVNRFDNLGRLGQCRSPVYIAQADKDQLIPYAHGEQLEEACEAPYHHFRLRGLDHNDPLPQEFFVDLGRFLTMVNLIKSSRKPLGETSAASHNE